jgi:crotonobetainyl-CoA:carnitine CoA-transferase CaiB-like acyl-CoA transferase
MFRAADGWMALNLAREEDRDLVPAWLGCDVGGDPWDLVAMHAPAFSCAQLRDGAVLLGLPACQVGEIADADAELLRRSERWRPAAVRKVPRVIDLSALWAGPLCGAVLAVMGAEVIKVESVRRPDPTRLSTPGFHERLNGAKAQMVLDLAAPADQQQLRELVLDADVVITSARVRGLASIGLDPDAFMASRAGLTWVAVTGYGLSRLFSDDPWNARVAFGDDAAAAGGLVGWTPSGEPRFLGDALSDPVTGLAAAVGALRALQQGGGVVVDAGMAPMARLAAKLCAPELVA